MIDMVEFIAFKEMLCLSLKCLQATHRPSIRRQKDTGTIPCPPVSMLSELLSFADPAAISVPFVRQDRQPGL